MTKPEIEDLIAYIDNNVPKHVVLNGSNQEDAVCRLSRLYDLLRDYSAESDKTCEPNWEDMYKRNAEELAKAQEHIASIQFDMHNLSIEHAHYTGAVAAMETIFGRKFDPRR